MRAAPTLLPAALSYEQRSTAGSRCAHAHLLGVARWCPPLAKNRYCSPKNQYCRRSGAQAQWFRRGSLVPSAGQKSVLQPEKSVLQPEKSVLQAKRGACALGFGVARWCPRLARNRYCRRSGAQAQWFRRGSLVPSAGQKSVLQAKRGAGAVGFGVARWCPRLARNRYCRRSGAKAQWFRRGSLVPSPGQKSVLQAKRGAGAVVSAWLVGALGWPEIGTAAVRRSHGRSVSPAHCCPPVSTRHFCSRHCPRRHTANTAASRPAPAQCRSPCSPLLCLVWVTGKRRGRAPRPFPVLTDPQRRVLFRTGASFLLSRGRAVPPRRCSAVPSHRCSTGARSLIPAGLSGTDRAAPDRSPLSASPAGPRRGRRAAVRVRERPAAAPRREHAGALFPAWPPSAAPLLPPSPSLASLPLPSSPLPSPPARGGAGACAVLESRAPGAAAPRSRSAHARRRGAAWRRAGTEFSLGRRQVFRTSGIDYMLP
ncbi:uncharacterized protein [Struthio camelus]|uniref:uncharacterized protein isoform X2 n=1 Tax=Struthio camelus TaxID=8801 RepID=UPI003603F441